MLPTMMLTEPPAVEPWMFRPHYHYDATAKETLYTDSAMTTAVVAESDPVGAWKDRSQNAFDITETTVSKKPIYKTAHIHGRPGVLGDGTDDAIFRATPTLSQPVTAYCVAKIDTIAASKNLYSGGTANAAERLRAGVGSTLKFIMSGGSTIVGQDADVRPHIHTALFNTTNSLYYIDGMSISPPVDGGSNNLVGISMLGNTNGSSIQASMGEFALFVGLHTPLQRQLIERYFIRKWGFQ